VSFVAHASGTQKIHASETGHFPQWWPARRQEESGVSLKWEFSTANSGMWMGLLHPVHAVKW